MLGAVIRIDGFYWVGRMIVTPIECFHVPGTTPCVLHVFIYLMHITLISVIVLRES